MPLIQERGPARYFHGREPELAAFTEELVAATENRGGTTFLVQGPPGVGKTALLAKCTEQARNQGWHAVDIGEAALYDPGAFMDAIDQRYKMETMTEVGGNVKIVCGTVQTHIAGAKLGRLMRDAAHDGGLLLVFDEVQGMADYYKANAAKAAEMPRMLNNIHNGKLQAPVILLAGGLGHSRDAFRDLGVSRFERPCFVNLGRLSPDAEHAVIRDWLVKDGTAAPDDPALSQWITTIASQTHGWPQHIMAFVRPAMPRLTSDGGRLVDKTLKAVLKEGRAAQNAYYLARVSALEPEDRTAIAALAADMRGRVGLSRKTLISRLATHDTMAHPEQIFSMSVASGVFARTPGEGYIIPVSPMRTWMQEEYIPGRPPFPRPLNAP